MSQTALCQMNVPDVCLVQANGEHHRKRRGEGDERPVNKMHACAGCHEWTHKHPEHARRLGWIVRTTDDPAEIPILGYQPLSDYEEGFVKKLWKKVSPKTEAPAEKRERKVLGIRCPVDPESGTLVENGIETLEGLIQAAREDLKEVMNWKDDVPAYFVLVAVLHDWLTGRSTT